MIKTTEVNIRKEWAIISSNDMRLFLISFVVLFFELVCIRWIPSYIRYLSFFSNFILLASFLGIGVGLLAAKRNWSPLHLFLPTLLLFVLIILFVKFELKIETGDLLYFHSTSILNFGKT